MFAKDLDECRVTLVQQPVERATTPSEVDRGGSVEESTQASQRRKRQAIEMTSFDQRHGRLR